jgi:hypothetical protein
MPASGIPREEDDDGEHDDEPGAVRSARNSHLAVLGRTALRAASRCPFMLTEQSMP